DIKTGASFPSAHALHPFPPSLYVTDEAGVLVRDADVILSLDWIDLGGTLRQACKGELPPARIFPCPLDLYSHNGWSMDYQALPPTDLNVLASPDRLVERLVEVLGAGKPPARPAYPRPKEESGPAVVNGRLAVQAMAQQITDGLARHN